MLNNEQGKTHYLFGDDLGDVERFLSSTPALWHRVYQSRSVQASHSWDLGVGYEHAKRLMRDGWSDGAARLNRGLSALPPPVTRHAKTKMDVAGYYPDVARYVSGDPANMAAKGREQGKTPVTRILVNGFMSSIISSQECINFGLALAACVDIMEASGRRVELDIAYVGDGMGYARRRYCVGWNVKKAGEALDGAALAFSLGHPAAFRRIGFAMIERTNVTGECPSYGYPVPMSQADKAMLSGEDSFFIEGIGPSHGACREERTALVFAAQQINLAAGETIVELED